MAVAAAVTRQWHDGKMLKVVGTLTFSGNYVTNGDTVNLSALGIASSEKPVWMEIMGVNGWTYAYVQGTDQTNGKVKVMGQQPTSAAAGVVALDQHAAAAYAATVTGDTVQFYAEFRPLV